MHKRLTGVLLIILILICTWVVISEQNYDEVVQVDKDKGSRGLLIKQRSDSTTWHYVTEDPNLTNRWGKEVSFESLEVGSRVKATNSGTVLLSNPAMTNARSIVLLK